MHGNSFQRKLTIMKGGVAPTVDVRFIPLKLPILKLLNLPNSSMVMVVRAFTFCQIFFSYYVDWHF